MTNIFGTFTVSMFICNVGHNASVTNVETNFVRRQTDGGPLCFSNFRGNDLFEMFSFLCAEICLQ